MKIAVECGVPATGDMLRRIGGHIGDIESRREAMREAQKVRKHGRLPH